MWHCWDVRVKARLGPGTESCGDRCAGAIVVGVSLKVEGLQLDRGVRVVVDWVLCGGHNWDRFVL